MIGLLLDSSDKNLSVGLVKDHVFLGKVSYEAWQRQSELLVEEIRHLLMASSLSGKEIDYVVCAKGPGSYTGVRIALTVAKTIACALDIPLYLASSLGVLASEEGPSICLMNARGKRSYFGVYQGGKTLKNDAILDNDEVFAFISLHPDYRVCGDVSYLGLVSEPYDVLENLNKCDDASHECLSKLGAKPIYLKDDYDKGHFKTIVRKMLPSDMASVMSIENEVFVAPYTEEQMLYELNENPVSHLYCAVVDNEVVGFVDFSITFNSAYISQIGVKEAFRRKGIGNLLIGQIIKDCESQVDPVEFLTLEVRESNEIAQRFYKKHKFQAVTIKKGYYSNGENAVAMVRSLIHG